MKRSDYSISVVLLAGGKGLRMKSLIPKQFLKIHDKEVALYSFELFNSHPKVSEIVVVADPLYWPLFQSKEKKVDYAKPGSLRQDSSYHGFLKTNPASSFVCIHDAARPCIDLKLLDDLFEAALLHGAAAPGALSTSTLKESNDEGFIAKTVDRSKVWVIQTPQVIERSLLKKGFKKAHHDQIEVTDDVALIERLGHPVKIVPSHSKNIKLTLAEDLKLAEILLEPKEVLT